MAALAQDKLAEDVVIMDMRPVCIYTDFFVIATGRNTRQTVSIWDEVHERMKQDHGVAPRAVDGTREGTWIVGDFLDIVLHVFTPEARAYYALEDLWADVPSIEPEAASA
jgi:ribosome-associated protein